MHFNYPAKLEQDEDGRVVVTFPDFGYGATDGADRDEALDEAQDLLRELLTETMREGAPLPLPASARGRPTVAPPAGIAAKAALYMAVREANMSGRALARELGIGETEARRILDPNHATKIDRLESALAHFGKRIEVTCRDVG